MMPQWSKTCIFGPFSCFLRHAAPCYMTLPMPVCGSGSPDHVVHPANTTPREQVSTRPILRDAVLSSWPCGDMLCGDMLCGDMLNASNPLSNPHSLHLFVVEGTLVQRPGQMTANKSKNSTNMSVVDTLGDTIG
jgi:hypothetical protein